MGLAMKRPNLVEIVTSLDNDEHIHLARILILLHSFAREDGPSIVGITKLAKLDFLLRYPTYFEKAIEARGGSMKSVEVEDYERLAVEAQMVRYRFGPWDHRYRRFLNILAAKALASLRVHGRTIQIDITEAGKIMAQDLGQMEEFGKLAERSKILKRHLDIGATKIMEFIYEIFPEIVSLEYNENIKVGSIQ